MSARGASIIIAGLGNLLLQDDGIGVRIIQELQKEALPQNVQLLEMGTGAFLLPPPESNNSRLLLVDALTAGKEPGTLYLITAAELLQQRENRTERGYSLHDFHLLDLLQMSRPPWSLNSCRIFGIEPAVVDFGCHLSPLLEEMLPSLLLTLKEEIATVGDGAILSHFLP